MGVGRDRTVRRGELEGVVIRNLRSPDRAVVDETDTAIAMGSGSVPVLATPRLAAWLEAAAVAALEGVVPAGSTTVGTRIDIRHIAATPVGKAVEAKATVTAAEGRTLEFDLLATEGEATIATGRHVRVVVDEERFISSLGPA